MSTIAAVRPLPLPTKAVLWAVSDGAYENHFTSSTTDAAVWLVEEAMRQLRRGQVPSVTAHRHDPFLGILWDATSDVADVFRAIGWPTTSGDILQLRAAAIVIVRDILVTDDTPTDAPEPGISDPHTYALVCR